MTWTLQPPTSSPKIVILTPSFLLLSDLSPPELPKPLSPFEPITPINSVTISPANPLLLPFSLINKKKRKKKLQKSRKCELKSLEASSMANLLIKNQEDVDREFCLGIEQLFNDCITSLSSSCDGNEESDLRLRSADLAETSAAAHRHSRILSLWAARHAEEMITTIERRNRESELMALAGLHTVSMLDSSFLRETSRSPSSATDPPGRASRLGQMWREIEDRRRIGDVSESEEEDRRSSREDSPDTERVREIVSRISETGGGRAVESPRSAEWMGETERERVRLVREWVQMASQERDGRSGRREGGGRERSRDGSVTDQEEGQPEHVQRDMLRIRGRQARLELVMRMVRERERELQGLEEQRVVSEFAHRNRIQV